MRACCVRGSAFGLLSVRTTPFSYFEGTPYVGTTEPGSVLQAGSVPGAARIAVTGSDGISSRYAVYFARATDSEEFNRSTVGRQWKWVRQDPARETLASGSLVITPTAGNVNGNLRTVRNLLLQPALGDWTIQS